MNITYRATSQWHSKDMISLGYNVWFKTFALFPITLLSGERVWFKVVYCMRKWNYKLDEEFEYEPTKIYGTILDVLKD